MMILRWILPPLSKLAQTAMLLLAIAGSVLAYGRIQRHEGAKQARSNDEEADHDHAASIHHRVERDLAQQLRKYDDAGYRD